MAMSAIAVVDGGSGATITDWIGSRLSTGAHCNNWRWNIRRNGSFGTSPQASPGQLRSLAIPD